MLFVIFLLWSLTTCPIYFVFILFLFTELLADILTDLIEYRLLGNSKAKNMVNILSGPTILSQLAGYQAIFESSGVKKQAWVKPSQPSMNHVRWSMFKCKNRKRKQTIIGKLVFSLSPAKMSFHFHFLWLVIQLLQVRKKFKILLLNDSS